VKLYRRSSHLVTFWEGESGVLYNYATAMQAQASTPAWRIVDFCSKWRSATEVSIELGLGRHVAKVRPLLDALVSASFLSTSGQRPDPREKAMEKWAPWNPAAGFFHTTSRQCVVGEQAWFDRRLKAKAVDRPMPSPVKPPSGRRVSLGAPEASGPLGRTVLERRTYRQFGKAPIEVGQLTEVLWLTSGITHWLTVPGLGEVALKGSPSGGARHPIETYVVVNNVSGLSRGTYRYAPDRHQLDQVARGITLATRRSFLPQQPWFAGCAAILFFTAVFERTSWRYEYPRAYRTVLLEAGHMCQTFLLASTSLGLAPFCTLAMDDERVERHLGIDGIEEAVLYTAGVGSRPPLDAAVRAVAPPGGEPGRVRRNATPCES